METICDLTGKGIRQTILHSISSRLRHRVVQNKGDKWAEAMELEISAGVVVETPGPRAFLRLGRRQSRVAVFALFLWWAAFGDNSAH